MTNKSPRTDRDFDTTPYSPDERRVADWMLARTKGMVGTGDDPIGFVLASYEQIHAENEALRKIADSSKKPVAPSS